MYKMTNIQIPKCYECNSTICDKECLGFIQRGIDYKKFIQNTLNQDEGSTRRDLGCENCIKLQEKIDR